MSAFAVAFLSAAALGADRIPLRIDIGGVATPDPVPVRAGIPLPAGALPSTDGIRVLIRGAEVDAQARRLAAWPDGSIKWALLDFFARDGDEAEVEYGADVARRPIGDGIRVARTAEAVTLDTGSVRLTARRDGTGFIDELAFDRDGDGRYSPREIAIPPAAAGERRNVLDAIHRRRASTYPPLGNAMPGGEPGWSSIRIDALDLEDGGPVRATILLRGAYVLPKLAARIAGEVPDAGTCPFTLRIDAWKGSAAIACQLHVVFDGVPDDDFIRAWGLRIPVAKGATVSCGGEGGTIEIEPTAEAPFASLVQESADSFRVWVAGADRIAQSTVARGGRAPGWFDTSGTASGVTIGIRRFRETWPNAIHHDAARGTLAAMLYPPESPPMDLRRLARYEWGIGETGAPDLDLSTFAPFAARGAGATKEVRIAFHRGPVDAARAAAEFAAFAIRPLAVAPPAYLASTRALGTFAPAAEDPQDRFERAYRDVIDRWRAARDTFRWIGMWDDGDLQQRFGDSVETHKHGRWENDWGRWGWGNNDGQGRIAALFLVDHLRTGRRLSFEMGEAAAKHIADVDVCGSRGYPWDFSLIRKIPRERTAGPWWDLRGCAHRHGAQHWSGPYLGARGGCPTGHRILFFLTGDGRIGDYLDTLRDMAVTRFGIGGAPSFVQRTGHSSGVDGLGTCLQALLVAWERTGDARWRDAIHSLCADPKGPGYALLHPRGSWDVGLSTAFGAMQAVAEFADLAGDAEARKIVVDAALAVREDPGLRKSFMWPGAFLPIAGDGYRFTGDPKLREFLAGMIDDAIRKGVDGNTGPAVAYAIGALVSREAAR